MKRLLLCLPFVFASCAAFAQSDPASERVDRLERDIMLLQRQLARSGMPVATSTAANSGEELTPSAGLEVRLSNIEESLRTMQGKLEENEFQARKLNENMDKLQRDVDFRFSELNAGTASDKAAGQAVKPTTDAKPKDATAANAETPKPTAEEAPAGPTTAGDGVLHPPGQETAGETFATPRDLYNHAFRLLNQTKYEEAADAFASFTKKYPKDPLAGNAYYWQGETFYIRRDYVNAADAFRQGFEILPNGPKAPDNLLKLAMSLDALDRDKEACVVLQQIITKFKKTSLSIVDKAGQEYKRMGCK